MTSTAARTITYAWIILSAITILSWWLAPGHARGATAVASAPIIVAVILFGIHQGTHDHSILHGSAHRTAVAQLFHAGWLTVLWAGILAIYVH